MRPKVLSRVPSAALSSRRPPYLDRVLLSAVPRRRQYYEGATTSHYTHSRSLICFASGPHAVPPCFVLAVASASERMEAPIRARIIVQPAIHGRLALAWTRVGSLRFPGDPSCAFAPFQDPGRTDAPSPLAVASGAAPAVGKAKAPAC